MRYARVHIPSLISRTLVDLECAGQTQNDNFLFVKATSESSAESFTQILFRISREEGRRGRESSDYIENCLS